MDFKTTLEVARLRLENSIHQADQARFALDKANDDLAKTTIISPIDGTVTKLKSQLGERVLGTSFNMGTEIMTIAKLDEMEARVDIGEIDVVLIEERADGAARGRCVQGSEVQGHRDAPSPTPSKGSRKHRPAAAAASSRRRRSSR